jgi:hypothetical protein
MKKIKRTDFFHGEKVTVLSWKVSGKGEFMSEVNAGLKVKINGVISTVPDNCVIREVEGKK